VASLVAFRLPVTALLAGGSPCMMMGVPVSSATMLGTEG